MAVWQALAKLCLHTDPTLTALEKATTAMGVTTRKFADKTATLDVYELPHEEAARGRQKALIHSKASRSTEPPLSVRQSGKEKATGRKRKTLNLSTFKWHNDGHVADAIRRVGTTDGVSTQAV